MTFLEQVTKYYVDKARRGEIDLGQYTFVFPNKRSASFLSNALKANYSSVGFMPRLLTITAFTHELCPRELASDTELLFLLYKSYCKVVPEEQVKPFDAFVRIGQTILSDFNEIDSYLCNAEMLYKNIESIKSTVATYLTADQIEVARLLGDKRDLSALKADVDNFWLNAKDKNSAREFMHLWEIMHSLYAQFNSDLQTLGLAYSGLQSRLAYEQCKTMDRGSFAGRKFAFIGFYVLPTSRLLTFKRLRDIGIADFFWDTASPLLTACGNSAGDIIIPLSQEFKMPSDFELEPIERLPEITVYPVASSAAQAKVAGEVLKSWLPEDAGHTIGTPTNGVVIPNDSLLMPILFSVPDRYNPISVAMKVPFGITPMAQLMDSILRTHERGRRIKGEFTFFYADIVEILSNPYIASTLHDSAFRLKELIAKKHLYNVSSAMICKEFEPLAFIFQPIGDQKDGRQCRDFVLGVVERLRALGIEPKVTDAYAKAIDQIFSLIAKHFPYGLDMADTTLFKLVRKIVSTTDITFNANPTWGLQLMNIPDARVLDFEQLIITSLNEGILPANGSKSTLIPPALRCGYGLYTPEDEDKTLAYQFFRLISRAKRVALIYDNRTPDLSQGEKSRFISQLELMMPDEMLTRDVKLGLKSSQPREVSIPKSEAVLAELEQLRPGGHLHFSASAFKTYLTCRLKFYLQYVKRLRVDNPTLQYMDAAAYGDVLHHLAELFYQQLQDRIGMRMITRKDIEDKIKEPAFEARLEQLALVAMCDKYYGKEYKDNLKLLPGEARINAKIMAEYVKVMLQCEAGIMAKNENSVDFRFIAGEDQIGDERHHVWKVDNSHTINFTLSIDRIDQIGPDQIRIIDYKTGNDAVSASNFDKIFSDHSCGAIFQLLLYCIAYEGLQENPAEKIKPLVYKFKDMATEGIPTLKICGKPIQDYRQEIEITQGDKKNKKVVDQFVLAERFRERFVAILDEIFGEDQPFDQTEDTDNCKFCPFTQMCGRVDLSRSSNF